jgi:hypothetical protein
MAWYLCLYLRTFANVDAMNNKHTVGGNFCDLSKAFDCVNHRILVSKLEHHGIRGTFGALTKSYLMERYQRVAIKDKTNTIYSSNWELVKHGVRQGSILSPFFFLLYINYLPIVTAKNAKLVLYAEFSLMLMNGLGLIYCPEILTKLHTCNFKPRTVKNFI